MMIMLANLTLNGVLIILIGLGFIVLGVWLGLSPGNRLSSIGLISTGAGNILLGLTNGFTDFTPIGRFLYRTAVIAYLIGVPIIGYSLYGFLNS